MIHLLTADDVKTGPSKVVAEAAGRIRDMALEEERLVNSINTLHVAEEEAKQHHDDVIQKLRNEAATERVNLELDIAPLKAERIELMKPIEVIRKEADDRNAQSKIREMNLTQRETAVSDRESDADEREADFIAYVNDTKQDLAERIGAVEEREAGAKAEATRLSTSSQELAQKWVEYHAAVDAKNLEMTERENKVAAGEKANEIRAAELDKLHADYQSKDREIADRYATLTAASTELTEREQAVAKRETENSK